MSIKAVSNACKEGGKAMISTQVGKKHSGTFLVALHWQFGALKVQPLTKYRSIAPQFIKHTAFEAPILQVVVYSKSNTGFEEPTL